MPYLKHCLCFEQAKMPPTDKMLRGTRMDAAFRKWVCQPTNDVGVIWGHYPDLTEQDMEDVLWAKDKVLELAGTKPVTVEKKHCKFVFDNPQGVTVSGEMDGFWKGAVIDLKSGNKHDYQIQLLPYATHLFYTFPDLEQLEGHLVYCSLREVDSATYTRRETILRMNAFIKAWLNPNKKPTQCDACKRCRNHTIQGGCILLACS